MSSPLAHTDDPDTSHRAARSLSAATRSLQKELILSIIAKQPATVEEVAEQYFYESAWGDRAKLFPSTKWDSIAKRMSELHNEGLIEDSGRRGVSVYKRPVVIWQIVKVDE